MIRHRTGCLADGDDRDTVKRLERVRQLTGMQYTMLTANAMLHHFGDSNVMQRFQKDILRGGV
jgi:hypothetical protein